VYLSIYYGGTFDPVHNGHLAIALAVQSAFNTGVVLLPSADPPHRPSASATAEQRADMVELAIAGHSGLSCDRRELYRPGKSYSVLTLRELREEHGPDQPLAWLIGIDSFLGLPSWRQWRELFDLCHFIVVRRPGRDVVDADAVLAHVTRGRWQATPEQLSQTPAGRIYLLPTALRPESGTEVRMGLQAGRNMNSVLAPPVSEYIQRHGLYSSGV
jgi:nicotinate-nucleotide adenylyltransferase